jgi:hypothetical protein
MPTDFCLSGAWSTKCGVALQHGALRHLPGQEEVMEPIENQSLLLVQFVSVSNYVSSVL